MFKSLVIIFSVLSSSFASAATPIDGPQALANAQKVCPNSNAIQAGLYYTDCNFGSITAQQASDGKISIIVTGLQPDKPYVPAGEVCRPASNPAKGDRMSHPGWVCQKSSGTPRNELDIDVIPNSGPTGGVPTCMLKLILKSENGPDVEKPIP